MTLYSPSERGFEAGSQPWDAAPGATLTAGWVADLRAGCAPAGRTGYSGGRSAFEVPGDTPVTQISPGEKALLEPGAAVTIFARSDRTARSTPSRSRSDARVPCRASDRAGRRRRCCVTVPRRRAPGRSCATSVER